ncbi:MAG: protein-disulfide reductase DsbD domain-containing protein [Pseudomonadota bacterium]
MTFRGGVWLLAMCVGLSAHANFEPPNILLDFASVPAQVRPAGTTELVVELTMPDGWHIHARKPTFDYLIPTEMTVDLPRGWRAIKTAYPRSVEYPFAFAKDEPLAVYEGMILFKTTVAVPSSAEPGPVNIHFSLRYQACSDRVCLPPVTRRGSIPLRIDPAVESARWQLHALNVASIGSATVTLFSNSEPVANFLDSTGADFHASLIASRECEWGRFT